MQDILRQPVMELLNQELMKIGAANLDSPVFKQLESKSEICLGKIPSQNEYMETSVAERLVVLTFHLCAIQSSTCSFWKDCFTKMICSVYRLHLHS